MKYLPQECHICMFVANGEQLKRMSRIQVELQLSGLQLGQYFITFPFSVQ